MKPSKPSYRSSRPAPGARRRPSPAPAPKVVVDRQGPLHAEIVVVGRELLRGQVRDGNAGWIAGELTRRGALVHRVTIVDDLERSITNAVSEARHRGVHLIVTTGGLGPALDDRTLAGVAEALNLPLTLSAPARDMVEEAYRALKEARVIGNTGLDRPREKMCMLPVGAEALPNAAGVAPGMLLRLTGGAAVVALPGRPEETRAVFEGAAERLRDLFPLRASAERELEAPTSDESAMRPVLDRLVEEFPGVWIKSHPPAGRRRDPIRVTLQSFAATQKEADTLVEGALRRLLALAGSR
ncbi:MAG TPA: molybdopterin-binding protein [Candidatus Polarisedimenticolaceae bacterium]|nr:molybdopterin-binding protein [Candidatus Polarisedimenticolaceae bacterium]